MRGIKDFINETQDSNGEVIPVMFNIYGHPVDNPWYFGYSNQEQVRKQMACWTTGKAYSEWAKIVVPFEKFDPNDLKQNLKYNLIK